MARCKTTVIATQISPVRKQIAPGPELPPAEKSIVKNVMKNDPPTYWMAMARGSAPRLMIRDKKRREVKKKNKLKNDNYEYPNTDRLTEHIVEELANVIRNQQYSEHEAG